MLTLDIRGDAAVDEYPGIAALAELAAEIHRSDPRLSEPILMHWSEEPVIAVDGGSPWLYCPVERDPGARDGRIVVPAAQRRRLAVLAAREQPFQRMAIAHELDPRGPVSSLLPVLRHGPRTCSDEVARAVVGLPPPHPVAARVVRGADRLLRRARGALTSAIEPLLDPVLFGVVGPTTPEHGDLTVWFPLEGWRW